MPIYKDCITTDNARLQNNKYYKISKIDIKQNLVVFI